MEEDLQWSKNCRNVKEGCSTSIPLWLWQGKIAECGEILREFWGEFLRVCWCIKVFFFFVLRSEEESSIYRVLGLKMKRQSGLEEKENRW